jgi:hypothetical protein
MCKTVETAKKGDAPRTTLVLQIGLKKFMPISNEYNWCTEFGGI